MRKYEIYLPIKYNDGTDIEPEKFRQVKIELSALFGGLTVSPMAAPFEGTWIHQGVEYRDIVIKFEIITSDDEKMEKFFKDYKETLKEVFQQKEILITIQEIRTL
jgi:hypothetical protein